MIPERMFKRQATRVCVNYSSLRHRYALGSKNDVSVFQEFPATIIDFQMNEAYNRDTRTGKSGSGQKPGKEEKLC